MTKEYPNEYYCGDCYNYDRVNGECGALFGPEITGYGDGKEHCMRRDCLTGKTIND